MPDIITAPNTRAILSFAIERVSDQNRKLFPVDVEIFDYINIVLKELARHSLLLKDDLFISLVPNQVEYDYTKSIDRLVNIRQIETVTMVDNSVETPPLDYKNKQTFRKEYQGNTNYTSPTVFTYDEINIAYWRPVSNTTSRLKLRVSRELLENEKVNQEQDPPNELWVKFSDFIKYGTTFLMASKIPDLTKVADTYGQLFQGYKDIQLIPKTLQSHKTTFKEF